MSPLFWENVKNPSNLFIYHSSNYLLIVIFIIDLLFERAKLKEILFRKGRVLRMKLKRKVVSLFVSTLALGSVFSSVPVSAQDAPEVDPSVEQTLSIATNGELSTLDSALYNDVPTSDMIGQINEGLYRVTTGSEVELGQAEDVNVSDDGLVYTFTLRDGLTWSNGDPVTAHDFVYSYQRLVDPNSGSVASTTVEIFKNAASIRNGDMELDELGVVALDDLTLEITLEYPAPYLPKLLTGSRFLPVSKAFVEEVGSSYATSSENLVSNGPFTLENWNGSNLEWNLVKNPNYWDADNVYLEDVLVQVVKETGTGADLFDAQQLDYAVLTDDFVQQYAGSEFFYSVPKSTVGYLSYNTTREATGNANIRRALSQAFDKELYAESVIQDGSTPLNGLVPVGFDVSEDGVDFRDEQGDILVYDVEQAQADWQAGLDELGVDSLELELLTSDVDLSGRTAEYLQAQLQENLPGLTLTIRSVPLQNRIEFQRNLEFDIFYGTWAPDYQDAINFIEQYRTDGGINFAEYSNEEYDALVEAAQVEYATDPQQRREALLEAERIGVAEDAVTAPIYQASSSYLLDPRVQNFEVYPFGRTINLRTTYVTE